MNWIKSNEREPSDEGKYFCKFNGEKFVLCFVKIEPKKEHFEINEHYDDTMIEERCWWTYDDNCSTVIHSNINLIWLEE
jgi:hypothetical protein